MKIASNLVSVITIFFNAEKYIEETIESVISQTYRNWELLLVDDGSSDRSTEIAMRYAQKYPTRIRYLEHENHQNCGMSTSRNLGIQSAEGEFIAFLDSDDVWLPERLVYQVERLNSQPQAAMVCAPNQLWYSWTGNKEDEDRDYIHFLGKGVKPNYLYDPPQLALLFWKNQARTPGTCSVLIRHQVFDELGGFEETFRGMFEDRVFFSKVYLNFSVYTLEKCFDKYRAHPESCRAISDSKYNRFKPDPEYLNFLEWTANYLSCQEVSDERVMREFEKIKAIHTNPVLFILWKLKNKILRFESRKIFSQS